MSWRSRTYDELPALSIRRGELRRALRIVTAAWMFGVVWMALVGGESLTFHLNAKGEVDYLEARPAPGGAAAERFTPFSHWTAPSCERPRQRAWMSLRCHDEGLHVFEGKTATRLTAKGGIATGSGPDSPS